MHERLSYEETDRRAKIKNICDHLKIKIADYDREYVWQEDQWCPSGLTRSQKRRVERLRNDKLQRKKHKVWQVKQTADKGKGKASANISTIFMLPTEFRSIDQQEELDEEEVAIAQWIYQAESATFEKPKKYLHLKALYLKGFVDGKPLTKMLVDGGAVVNLMPYFTFRKLGKTAEDLCQTNMRLTDFSGNVSATKGAVCVELTIGSKSLPTTFFVVDAKGTYSILLGGDWIHVNCCIPFTIHQSLIQWIGDTVKVVPADSILSIAYSNPNE